MEKKTGRPENREGKHTRRDDFAPRPQARPVREEKAPDADLIVGRNAVREALKSGRPANTLFIKKGEKNGPILPLVAQAKEKNIPVKEVDPKKLDFMCGHQNHQGVILSAAAHTYATVEEILAKAEEKNEAPFIVICDGIEDPHNLGAIIRSAEAGGAHGIILPERRSAALTGIVGKTSAGALEYMPVARVTNLTATIRELQKKGVWVYAADMDGAPYDQIDFSGPIAIVIGAEGAGVSRLVGETCDKIVSIPMTGKINSLNASVAAGILIFRAALCRKN